MGWMEISNGWLYGLLIDILFINRKTSIKIDFMDDDQPTYKRIQDYVFGFSDRVGKGNFSQVYQGIHEPSRTIVNYHRETSRHQSG